MKLAVIGLGYVGLPLAIGLSNHFSVIGFDNSADRLNELHNGKDRTGEVSPDRLRASTLRFTDDIRHLADCDIFIVTVPTPVDAGNNPDLGMVLAASKAVGSVLSQGAIVVYESTVYPGVTEDVCGPVLEEASGLTCGKDFFLGYSPERINPGDREHTVERIPKVVAGQTPEVSSALAEVYGKVTSGGIFVAKDIRTAEAAKVIENTQRDINIAFMNELAMIFKNIGLNLHDVLEAASTKWNFLPFSPGLVGGHCIGVDPFYLAHCSQAAGHHPEIILAGRRINDAMGRFVADQIHAAMDQKTKALRVLVLGLTFKENVPDLRNTKVADVVRGLEGHGHRVEVHDPLADPKEAKEFCSIDLLANLEGVAAYDCVVGAVPHDGYRAFTTETFRQLLNPGGLVADIKGMWRQVELPEGIRRWQL